MEYDQDKVDEMALALLYLTMFNEGQYGVRAWKGHDWEVMNRLHVKGYISDPKGNAKSVVMTTKGHRDPASCSRSTSARKAGTLSDKFGCTCWLDAQGRYQRESGFCVPPFPTGKQNMVDTAGRVKRFCRKYAKSDAGKAEAAKVEAAKVEASKN